MEFNFEFLLRIADTKSALEKIVNFVMFQTTKESYISKNILLAFLLKVTAWMDYKHKIHKINVPFCA